MNGGSFGTATTALLRLAERAQTFTLDGAVLAVLGRDGTQAERNRVACIAWKLVSRGQLVKAGRGRYKSAIEKPPPIDELRIVTPRPAGPVAVRCQINRMAHVLAEFHAITGELLSDLHKANGSAGFVPEDGERPTGFPMRLYASTSTVKTIRRREPMERED
jgi:hypothetical protein